MFCSEVHHWVHLVSVFLQECILTLFDLHPKTLVQNNFAFLQLQRRLLHPVEHEHEMISWQAFGIGSCVIRSGWSLLSAIFFCPNVSGSGRWGSEQWACFHTIDPFIWFPIAFWKHIDLWRPRSCTTSFFWYSCITHFSSLSVHYKSSSTVRTVCCCPSAAAMCTHLLATVIRVSNSCPGAWKIGKYPIAVTSCSF